MQSGSFISLHSAYFGLARGKVPIEIEEDKVLLLYPELLEVVIEADIFGVTKLNTNTRPDSRILLTISS